MGLFIQQNDSRSKLQERIETELRDKAKQRVDSDPELPDGVDDSGFLLGTKKTTSLAWVWIIILVAIIVVVIWAIVASSGSASVSV